MKDKPTPTTEAPVIPLHGGTQTQDRFDDPTKRAIIEEYVERKGREFDDICSAVTSGVLRNVSFVQAAAVQAESEIKQTKLRADGTKPSLADVVDDILTARISRMVFNLMRTRDFAMTHARATIKKNLDSDTNE